MSEPTKMQVDTAMVRELAELLDATNLSEIEVRDGERQIKVVRKLGKEAAAPLAPAPVASSPAIVAAAAAAPVAQDDWKSHAGLVRAPIVGTAYLTPEPGAAPYVSEGDSVKAGETLLIIEAMKTMNQIPAPRAGRVTHVFVDNGHPVEYGEPLVVIE